MLLATKLTRQLKNEAERYGMKISVRLSNIRINGETRGCCGFAVNEDTRSCVYINTEHSVYGPLSGKSMYRYARDMRDFSSNGLRNGQNCFAEDTALVAEAILMLKSGCGIPR